LSEQNFNLPVCEAVSTSVISVTPGTKLDDVARLFEEHDINAAPVVDGLGKCVGIITSHNVVEYEAHRIQVETESKHGWAFNMARYGDGESQGLIGQPYDEVAYHMSTDFDEIGGQNPMREAGKLMCHKHVHHLVMLDSAGCPIGILSSLDILGRIFGEPVSRLKRSHRSTSGED